MVEVRGPLAYPQGLGRFQGASLANLAAGTQDPRQELEIVFSGNEGMEIPSRAA
ncbi:MAG: hypothetical protein ACFFAS_04880 [Promethearchaeota archaeon]